MEIFNEFGINPLLLIAQIVNILIILFVLKKFMYKPVLGMLKKRENDIKEGLKQAEEGRQALERATEEERNILKVTQNQAKKLILDAREQALEVASQIEQNSKMQAERIMTEAKEQIDQDMMEAEKKLALNVNDLSINLLTKALEEMFSEKEEKLILDRALKKISKLN